MSDLQFADWSKLVPERDLKIADVCKRANVSCRLNNCYEVLDHSPIVPRQGYLACQPSKVPSHE